MVYKKELTHHQVKHKKHFMTCNGLYIARHKATYAAGERARLERTKGRRGFSQSTLHICIPNAVGVCCMRSLLADFPAYWLNFNKLPTNRWGSLRVLNY